MCIIYVYVYFSVLYIYLCILQPDVEFWRDKDGQLLLQKSTPSPLTSEPAAVVGKKGKGRDKPVTYTTASISNTKEKDINGKL